MATGTKRPSLVAIVGPTASGKSALAMKIAQQFNGEIICADSRTIYKGMDIGTGKPSKKDQTVIKHHLLDLVEVNEFFSAANFQRLAVAAINDIQKRGKLPLLVGGSGLYINSVLFDFEFLPPANKKERERLNSMSVEELQQELVSKKIALPLNHLNKRHLVRALETNGAKPHKKPLRKDTLVVGVNPDNLKELIAQRDHQMIEQGLEAEVKKLTKKYGRDAVSLDAIGYREWQAYFDGQQTLAETEKLIVRNSILYSKRQMTWLKRNPHIEWFSGPEAGYSAVKKALLNT